MIDTDKYEGHTPGPWWMPSMELRGSSEPVVKMATFKKEPSLADRILIADAPLILEAYKRLREQNKLMVDYFRFMRDRGFTDADWRTVNEWIGDEEE